jgi:uncharacterized protein YegP (UPF0339 family)
MVRALYSLDFTDTPLDSLADAHDVNITHPRLNGAVCLSVSPYESNHEDVVVVHRDHAGQWQWTRVARNHEKVSWSGQHFASKRNAKRAAQRVNPDAKVQVAR